ncbi:malignant T-cell-amplified sequence 1-like [Oscarella lobularis]|uniref:malignant T-cell-amplified sequence 1-like n=1 Tax=Oscarella lobularis TaxID=121494 RepID=UPI0033139057
MFKKFQGKDDISAVNQVKSSVRKGIRANVLETFPGLGEDIDAILPKKEPLKLLKCKDHVEILSVNSELLFFRQRDGPYFPTLRLLHKYPKMLPHLQVDKGAIKFLLSGANIMCPGLTSPGAKMDEVDAGKVVAIMAEGKEHACAVGLTKLSTEDIQKVNKGIGVDNIHFLCDGLWLLNKLE